MTFPARVLCLLINRTTRVWFPLSCTGDFQVTYAGTRRRWGAAPHLNVALSPAPGRLPRPGRLWSPRSYESGEPRKTSRNYEYKRRRESEHAFRKEEYDKRH